MLATVRYFFPLGFFLVWFGGGLALNLRMMTVSRAFLKLLQQDIPALKDNPLVMRLYLPNYYPVYRQLRRDVREAVRWRQADPERERLRRRIVRTRLYMILWVFGYPLLIAAVIAFVRLTTGVFLFL